MAIFTVTNACRSLIDMFGLGIHSAQKYAELASWLEDGVEELVKMQPEPEKDAVMAKPSTVTYDSFAKLMLLFIAGDSPAAAIIVIRCPAEPEFVIDPPANVPL